MTIRVRLAWIFIGMVLLVLLITTGLAWYELVEEPAEPDAPPESTSWQLIEIVVRGAGPVILLALVAWWLTQRLLRPIEGLTQAAKQLQGGKYGEQIPMPRGQDELAQLTMAFNAMSLQIAKAFKGIRDFTLHASHELKTPLTLLRIGVERQLSVSQINSPERDEFAGMLDEVHRLTKIVDALSLLTNADANLVRWEQQPVDLQALLTAAREDAEALADGHDLQVTLSPCDPVTVQGDRFRVRQLLLILTDNAVKYNQRGGFIRLGVESQPGEAVLTFANSGSGLGEDQQAQVFDRFFRGREARALGLEGSGLGLSIAHSIVQAHEGTIRFQSDAAETLVTIRLPLA